MSLPKVSIIGAAPLYLAVTEYLTSGIPEKSLEARNQKQVMLQGGNYITH